MRFGGRLALGAMWAMLVVRPDEAAGQHLSLEMNHGLVTLQADGVSVRAILERWAALAGITVINGDQLPGTPVTLHFPGIPERQALEVLLRDASGYMLLASQSARVAGQIDRIVIVRASSPQPHLNTPAPTLSTAPVGQPGTGGGTPLPAASMEAIASDASETGETSRPMPRDPVPAPTAPSNPFGIVSGTARPGTASATPGGAVAGSAQPGSITPVHSTEPIIAPSSGGANPEYVRQP